MVYELQVPYVHTPKDIDVTMVFDMTDGHFIEAEEYNKSDSTVKYNLGYGEYLVLHLKCDDRQCNLDAREIGIYDQNKLAETEHYSTTLGRFGISIIATVRYAPRILRSFLRYMRPFDIPDEWYNVGDTEQIVEKIAKFFDEYFSEDE